MSPPPYQPPPPLLTRTVSLSVKLASRTLQTPPLSWDFALDPFLHLYRGRVSNLSSSPLSFSHKVTVFFSSSPPLPFPRVHLFLFPFVSISPRDGLFSVFPTPGAFFLLRNPTLKFFLFPIPLFFLRPGLSHLPVFNSADLLLFPPVSDPPPTQELFFFFLNFPSLSFPPPKVPLLLASLTWSVFPPVFSTPLDFRFAVFSTSIFGLCGQAPLRQEIVPPPRRPIFPLARRAPDFFFLYIQSFFFTNCSLWSFCPLLFP